MAEELSTPLVKSAIIAAGYAAITILIAPIAYGPYQFRISDVLMPIPYLPYFGISGIIGITVGTLIANLISPYSFWDVILGTLANLISGTGSYLAWRMPNKTIGKLIAVVIPVVVVTVLIGYVLLHVIFGVPFWVAISGIFISETVTAGIGGYIFITRLEKVLGSTVVQDANQNRS